jgi:hypothetical protein
MAYSGDGLLVIVIAAVFITGATVHYVDGLEAAAPAPMQYYMPAATPADVSEFETPRRPDIIPYSAIVQEPSSVDLSAQRQQQAEMQFEIDNLNSKIRNMELNSKPLSLGN